MTLLVAHPDTFAAERAYAHDVVLREFLGLRWESRLKHDGPVELTLAGAQDDARLLIDDGLFGAEPGDWLTERSLPRRPLAWWDTSREAITPTLVSPRLPVLYGESGESARRVEQSGGELRLRLDVFGSVFFALARYEELAGAGERDAHERFPSHATIAAREGFLDRPFVDEYVEVLRAALARLWPSLPTARSSFTERLSHDVDWPFHSPLTLPAAAKMIAGDLVRRRDPGLVPVRVATLRAQRRRRPAEDPYNTFDLIMDRSEERGLRSSFYFMAGRTDPRFDSTYTLDDDWIGTLMKRIHARGHEIGLHPSYGTFRDPELISAEFQTLRGACERLGIHQSAWGGRQHFLRWENPTTWRGWEAAGLAYDSSLGYSDSAGFRCGVCHEYPVFDLLARRRLRLRERPLVVMEMSVFEPGPARDAAGLETVARLRDRCRLFGGEFTLLWHNSRLASRREKALYAAALSGPHPDAGPGAGHRPSV
jgi:hypothetical protein